MSADFEKPKHVVIAGAGVIGLSTAYYLVKDHDLESITLVDPTGRIAPAASGKAGGFLALDWNDGTTAGPLARRSFQLHQQLADDLGAERIDYRRLSCVTIPVDAMRDSKPTGKKLANIEWAEGSSVRSLGDTSTIAQVHPKKLCEALWEAVASRSKLLKGSVVGASHAEDGSLQGATLSDGSVVDCDAVLFACGPWTSGAMLGIKYHSVVLPTPRVYSQCVFFSGAGDPEVYVRPDQTAYCTGFPEAPRRVTEKPGEESLDPKKLQAIKESVKVASQVWSGETPEDTTSAVGLGDVPVLEQACYLPSTPDGVPMMGELSTDVCGGRSCYVAAGHSCWGILMGPASGEAMASLIATGKSAVIDLEEFDPSRYQSMLKPMASEQIL